MKYIILSILAIIQLCYSVTLPLKNVKPKLCINCRFFITDNDTDEYGKCRLFEKKRDISQDCNFLVNGINKDEPTEYFYCSTARSNEYMCGINGKLHSRKYNKKSNL